MPAKQAWYGIHCRTTAGHLAWFRRLVAHAGTSASEVIRRALADFAASAGFEPPPPRN